MKTKDILIFATLACFLIGTITFIYFLIVHSSNDFSLDNSGKFGDTFGALNAVFTGLAFAGVILTLVLQSNDIAKQRKETAIQNFETVFFQMLNLHNEIVKAMDHQLMV